MRNTRRNPDRIRKRNEMARVVELSIPLDLNRSADGQSPNTGIKSAVLASVLLGQPEEQIAAQYDLPVATVKRWKEAFDITDPVNRRDRLSEDLFIFLEQEIKNLISISVATSDQDWIQMQSASELAAFINVKYQAIMKVLESFGRASIDRDKYSQQQLEVVDSEGE